MKYNRWRSTWSDAIHRRVKAWHYTLSVADGVLLLLLLRLVYRMTAEAGRDTRRAAVRRASAIATYTWYRAHNGSSGVRCSWLVVEVPTAYNRVNRSSAQIS